MFSVDAVTVPPTISPTTIEVTTNAVSTNGATTMQTTYQSTANENTSVQQTTIVRDTTEVTTEEETVPTEPVTSVDEELSTPTMTPSLEPSTVLLETVDTSTIMITDTYSSPATTEGLTVETTDGVIDNDIHTTRTPVYTIAPPGPNGM